MVRRFRPRLTRFGLVHIGMTLAAAAIWTFALTGPTVHVHSSSQQIDPKSYGTVQAYDGAFVFTLAPNSDQRRKYELGFGRVVFASAGLTVSNDGKKFYPLQGEPMGQCGYHWQGQGLNVVVAIAKCVPGWATVTGDPQQHHAAEWIRVENLSPVGRRVLLKYDPLEG